MTSEGTVPVLAFCNRVLWASWLGNNRNVFLMVLGTERSKSQCQHRSDSREGPLRVPKLSTSCSQVAESSAEGERGSWLSHDSDKAALMTSSNLIILHRAHLLTPSHWKAKFQHTELGWEPHKHSALVLLYSFQGLGVVIATVLHVAVMVVTAGKRHEEFFFSFHVYCRKQKAYLQSPLQYDIKD